MKIKPALKILLATFLLALVMLPAMAQERQVTGTVFEPDGTTPVAVLPSSSKVRPSAPALT